MNEKIYYFDSLTKLAQFLKENKGKEVEIFYLRNNQENLLKSFLQLVFI
jgi:hypothetical protein